MKSCILVLLLKIQLLLLAFWSSFDFFLSAYSEFTKIHDFERHIDLKKNREILCNVIIRDFLFHSKRAFKSMNTISLSIFNYLHSNRAFKIMDTIYRLVPNKRH